VTARANNDRDQCDALRYLRECNIVELFAFQMMCVRRITY
jgi:hypothetical protein